MKWLERLDFRKLLVHVHCTKWWVPWHFRSSILYTIHLFWPPIVLYFFLSSSHPSKFLYILSILFTCHMYSIHLCFTYSQRNRYIFHIHHMWNLKGDLASLILSYLSYPLFHPFIRKLHSLFFISKLNSIVQLNCIFLIHHLLMNH